MTVGDLDAALAFHRNALQAKCAGLDAEQLVTRSAPPSPLSLLGLVRHLTEMQRGYAGWALGPRVELRWVWGSTPTAARSGTSTPTRPWSRSRWPPGSTSHNGHADLIRERIDGQTGE